MAKCLLQVSMFALAVSPAIESRAQVFNAPAPQSGGVVQQAGGQGAASASGTVEQTGWGIQMPKITMPKMTMPKITMPDVAAVTGPIKSGFGKMKAGSKKAWEGAKEMLSFGKNNQAATTGIPSQQKPSIWQRLTARDPQPQVPQTVGEFMSQPRLDP